MRECVCVCGKNEWGGRVGGGARKWVDGRKCVWVISVWEEGAYGGRGVYGGRGSVWGDRECV